MKVAFLVNHFPSPSQTFILNQIVGLLERGIDVTIFANRPADGPVHADVERHQLFRRTRYFRIPKNPMLRIIGSVGLFATELPRHPRVMVHSLGFPRYGRNAWSLALSYAARTFLGKQSFDILHAHFGPSGVLAVQLREINAFRAPIVTTFHGYDVHPDSLEHAKRQYALLFTQGNVFTVNSAYTGERLRALGCPADRILKLPVGVDLARFPMVERNWDHGEETRILTVARLVEIKGIEFGIRAVARLLKMGRRVRYVIVGDGPLRGKLEAAAGELGIKDQVYFEGAQTQAQVVRLMKESHIFVLPSILTSQGGQEGQGLVLLEAQASGLPVVATRTGGISECILNDETGFLVADRDPEALAERISWLIEHPERSAAMGEAGRRFVAERFDGHRLNDQLMAIYKNLTRPNLECAIGSAERQS